MKSQVKDRKRYVNISIPKELYDNVARAIEGTGFRSPTEFIIFTIRNVLMERNETKLVERLRKLGYFKD